MNYSGKIVQRKVFDCDLEQKIKPYLKEMRSEIKCICDERNLIYPSDHPGKYPIGVRPNIPYAIHFMLMNMGPISAAYHYVAEQTGLAIKKQVV